MGRPHPPWALDHVPHDDPADLRARRDALDREIAAFVGALDAARLAGEVDYDYVTVTVTDAHRVRQELAPALVHFFNHQTHHRGQCHAMLTRLSREAPALDLVCFQREQLDAAG